MEEFEKTGEAVIVSVYEERPGKRRVLSSLPPPNSHHHHYVHHVIKQEVTLNKNGDSGKGYSRRAELLHYSQRLRDKPRFSRSTSPACLNSWKILIPNICRSLTSIQAKQKKKKKHTGSTSNGMKAVMKTLEGQQKKGFILKLLSKLQRHR
ncbi:hypothetical protein SADUNF_Sadunf01G0124400 [Salix dunnii]|uniref:Uncharacterized protein n=1 Tax=Salix dunnii TaxID=1413687 RepID=A0A835TMJ0_9ROSI|nr:hypothetical protein SADUNF_Sadunf01G0124400 [Salix dunnii]